jgi:vacuolar protein-sorting-associated protein 4
MDGAEWFTPCDAKDEGAIPLTWNGVPLEKLKEPPLMSEDFFAVLKHAKVSVGSEEIKKYDEWTKKYGLEGA